MDILIKKFNKYNAKYLNKNNDIYLHKINYYKNLINQYGGLQKVFEDIKENIIRINQNNYQPLYTQKSVDDLINEILNLTNKDNQTKINELEILHQELQKLRKIKVTSNGQIISTDLILPEDKKEEIRKIKIKLDDINKDPETITNLMTEIIIQNIKSNDNNKSLVQIMANLIILNKETKLLIRNKLIQELPKYNLNYSDINISVRNILDEKMYKAI